MFVEDGYNQARSAHEEHQYLINPSYPRDSCVWSNLNIFENYFLTLNSQFEITKHFNTTLLDISVRKIF